jgi:tetratricopeptide (TPR) repeat protein
MSEVSAAKPAKARAAADKVMKMGWSSRLADGLLVGAFLALTFLLGVFPLKDTDFWWHLRTGDWIRQHGWPPSHDLYTFTVPDAPWIDLHWGFEVLLSWGYPLGGIEGLNLAKCVITCAAVLLLITARKRDWPIGVMLLAWLPALLVLGGRMYVRPETISFLYLSIFLALLFRWDRLPFLAYILPIVQMLWVNTQGLFIFGPIVLGLALIDAALAPGAFSPSRRRWWRTVGLATGLTGLACLINPYGLMGTLFPFKLLQTMRDPVFHQHIAELTPIPQFIQQNGLRNLPLQLHLATMGLGALSFLAPICWRAAVRFAPAPPPVPETPKKEGKPKGDAKRSRRSRRASEPAREDTWRLSSFRLLLFLSFSTLSLQATRNTHQFAAVVGTVTAWNFGEWAAALRRRRIALQGASAGAGGIAPRATAFAAIALVFVLVASGLFYEWAGEGRTIGLGEEPLWFPHEAAKFAGRSGMPPRFLGFHNGTPPLYEYEYGPERKVFADARLEVIGPELFEQYLELQRRIGNDEPGWDRQLDELGRPVVLADHAQSARIGAALLAHPRWRCVWFDPIAAVFVHDTYANVARTYTIDFNARHYRPDPAAQPRGLPALIAEAKGLRNYVDALRAQGRFERTRPLTWLGLDEARRVLRAAPHEVEGWKLLGQLEMFRDPPRALSARFRQPFDPVLDLSTVRATYALQQALERKPDDFLALLLLVELYRLRAMDEAALPLLERLARLHPINALQTMAQAQAEAEIPKLRSRLGAAPNPASPPNRSEHDRAVHALLRAGRAQSAADLIERDFPAESRTGEQAERLATLRLHLGQPAQARTIWRQAPHPSRPGLRASRVAFTYLVEEDFESARRAFHEALAADPDLFEANYGLAILEHDAARATEALAAARRALALARRDVEKAAAYVIVAAAEPFAVVAPKSSTNL